jgi:3-deoxy-D-manno-octulosonic-acid transferase
MIIFYTIFISLLRCIYRFAALFHEKAKAFVKGRIDIFENIAHALHNNTSPVIWVHCASLGEFEQGRPLIEAIKNEWPKHKILLTFFSPSGFEVQKNYTQADFIFYLPWDTKQNAQRFIALTKPILSIFVKYEFWHYYLDELKKQGIPILSVSSIFRPNQLFFKSYGKFYRNILRNFTYFFVQNDVSIKLLHSIGIENCKQAGDTRFDRVAELTQQSINLPVVEKFKDAQHTWVIGSCWAEDMKVLAPFINAHAHSLKFIIAPHEIQEAFMTSIEHMLEVKTTRFSTASEENLVESCVLIIDNIGMLSKLYRYGEFAYVGGAFGKGLHNILEPACYGIPIFFGNENYKKYQEATDLIMRGGAFEVSDYLDLKSKYELLMSRPENYVLACDVASAYVTENLGATTLIMEYCKKLLKV